VAAGLALTLMLAAPSAVAQPWQDWRSWDPFRQGGSVYSFNWLQNYPKLLNPANNVTIMRVDSPTPSYWRANALDSFTGNAWVSSQSFPLRPEVAEDAGAFTYSITPFEPTPKGKTVKEIFNLSSVYTNYIFVGGEPRELTMTQQILLRTNDMRALHVSRAIGPNVEYAATAVVPNLKPADLVGKGDDYPNGLDRYLELPFPAKSALIAYEDDALSAVVAPDSIEESAWRLMMADQNPEWLELYSLDQQIVGDATDPYDKTLRIELYLRKFFDYSLTPPASTYSSPYAAFLFDTRTGYCQHFSGAMSLLLRFNGIPARVAVGFTTGELERGAYTVATNNAHAWVEVYFPQVGWVAFDPTPGRNIPTAGPSSTSPGFINPFADSSAGGETTPTQPPREQLPEESGPEPGSTEDEGSFWSGISWLPWLVGILVLATVWPVGRSLWRSRDLRRGSTEHRLEASLRLLRTGLAEYGAPAGLALTTEETLRVIQVHLGIEVDSRFAERTDAVLFGSVRAVCEDLDGAEELRRQVNARLRKRHGWARTGLAWYGVPRRTPANGSAA
jgi:transglutaminase-like putative cysteine protease